MTTRVRPTLLLMLVLMFVALSLATLTAGCGKSDGDRRAPEASAAKKDDKAAGSEGTDGENTVKSADNPDTGPPTSAAPGKPTDQPVESPSVSAADGKPAPAPGSDPLLGGGAPLKAKKGSKMTALGDKGGESFAGDNNDPFGGTLDGGGTATDAPKPAEKPAAKSSGGDRSRKGFGMGLSGSGKGGGGSGDAPASGGISKDDVARPDVREVGKPVVQGDLDNTIVRNIQRRNRSQLAYCYRQALKARGTKLEGKASLDYVIGDPGQVLRARVTLSTPLEDKALKTCIVSRVKRWRFPNSKGEAVKVRQQYRFQVKRTR